MQIQSNLASTIAMAFEECAPAKAERAYVENSVARTTRWLERCKAEMARLNSQEDTINKNQLLFGINQGAIYTDIRIEHAKRISELNLDGYAVGGLARWRKPRRNVPRTRRNRALPPRGQTYLPHGRGNSRQHPGGR